MRRLLLTLLLLPALVACTQAGAAPTRTFDGDDVARAARATLADDDVDTTVHVTFRAAGVQVTFRADGRHDFVHDRSEGTIRDVTGGGRVGSEVLEGLDVRTDGERTELRHERWGDAWVPTPSPPVGLVNVPTVIELAARSPEDPTIDARLDEDGRLRRVRFVLDEDDLHLVLVIELH